MQDENTGESLAEKQKRWRLQIEEMTLFDMKMFRNALEEEICALQDEDDADDDNHFDMDDDYYSAHFNDDNDDLYHL